MKIKIAKSCPFCGQAGWRINEPVPLSYYCLCNSITETLVKPKFQMAWTEKKELKRGKD